MLFPGTEWFLKVKKLDEKGLRQLSFVFRIKYERRSRRDGKSSKNNCYVSNLRNFTRSQRNVERRKITNSVRTVVWQRSRARGSGEGKEEKLGASGDLTPKSEALKSGKRNKFRLKNCHDRFLYNLFLYLVFHRTKISFTLLILKIALSIGFSFFQNILFPPALLIKKKKNQ